MSSFSNKIVSTKISELNSRMNNAFHRLLGQIKIAGKTKRAAAQAALVD
jgi:hypothetical protein